MDPIEHANNTNPCVGICVSDDSNVCIGCYRTQEERNEWYSQSTTWREQVLIQLKQREEDMFGKDD